MTTTVPLIKSLCSGEMVLVFENTTFFDV